MEVRGPSWKGLGRFWDGFRGVCASWQCLRKVSGLIFLGPNSVGKLCGRPKTNKKHGKTLACGRSLGEQKRAFRVGVVHSLTFPRVAKRQPGNVQNPIESGVSAALAGPGYGRILEPLPVFNYTPRHSKGVRRIKKAAPLLPTNRAL